DEAIAFLAMAAREGVDVYAEERVSIRRELAIVATRSADGTFLPYPVVGSTQTRGVCDFVEGPARNFDLAPEREARVVEFARRIAERTTYVGTFAIEFFETSEGDLLVNEIAPRVHNSGHYTLDAARTSQFEQHLRAALGMPLGSVE